MWKVGGIKIESAAGRQKMFTNILSGQFYCTFYINSSSQIFLFNFNSSLQIFCEVLKLDVNLNSTSIFFLQFQFFFTNLPPGPSISILSPLTKSRACVSPSCTFAGRTTVTCNIFAKKNISNFWQFIWQEIFYSSTLSLFIFTEVKVVPLKCLHFLRQKFKDWLTLNTSTFPPFSTLVRANSHSIPALFFQVNTLFIECSRMKIEN